MICIYVLLTLSTRFRNDKHFFFLKLSQLEKKHESFYFLLEHGVNVASFRALVLNFPRSVSSVFKTFHSANFRIVALRFSLSADFHDSWVSFGRILFKKFIYFAIDWFIVCDSIKLNYFCTKTSTAIFLLFSINSKVLIQSRCESRKKIASENQFPTILIKPSAN